MPDEQKETSYQLDETPGLYGAFDYSPEPFAELTEDEKNGLQALCQLCSKQDVAARRMEVEQAWEARLFDRGYQHLLPRKNGGWTMPGENTGWGPMAQLSRHALYSTNVYGEKGEIITAALTREIPKVQFSPVDPNFAPDKTAADAANLYKQVYMKNNDLRDKMVEMAKYFWTDDRVCIYTRHVLDAQKYGLENDTEDAPAVPETEMNPDQPDVEGQFGQEEVDQANESPVKPGRPRGVELSTIFGKLEHKVPMTVQDQSQMHYIQIFEDVDCTIARGRFPWIADNIQPGGSGVAEIELDRIARMNSKLAIQASYVTGDALKRDVTITYTWVRPQAFLDPSVDKELRESYMEKFPKGALIVYAGNEMAFARNESMDDHVTLVHPWPGPGQNRRALGSNLISVQKRLNDTMDLIHDFFVRTVPKKWMDSEAFDVESIKKQTNIPGAVGPFQRQPGVPVTELIFVEPTPTHQPSMPDFIKWFKTGLAEEISGALPSLFGAATNTDTVGGIAIQRDQALGRIGTPWNALQKAIAEATRQAVMSAAEAREGRISDMTPGGKKIVLEAADLRGNINCYPEYDANFPESWSQREQRWVEISASAASNPFAAALLQDPNNARIAADAMRMQDVNIPGADAIAKQEAEFEVLLQSGPLPNPQKVEFQSKLEQLGQSPHAQDPDAATKLQQAQQQLGQIPDEVSTVFVAQDESQDHLWEAAKCKWWMNSSEGRKYANGTEEMKAAFQNVYTHWKEHNAMAAKIKAQESPATKPPGINISLPMDKLPNSAAIQALQKAGINISQQDFQQKSEEDQQAELNKKLA